MFEVYDLDKNWQFTQEEFETLFCEELEICGCQYGGSPCSAEAFTHLVEFDITENGELSTVEFAEFYATHGQDLLITLDAVWETYDLDSNWLLSFEEFKAFYCKEAFGHIHDDDNGSGVDVEAIFNEFAGEDDKLSQSEFSIIYYLHCQECELPMNQMFNHYDRDHDNLLCLEDLQCIFCEAIDGNEECPVCEHDGHLDPIEIFKEYDVDYSEQICPDEFGTLFYLYCNNC